LHAWEVAFKCAVVETTLAIDSLVTGSVSAESDTLSKPEGRI
jgi:hypothetical protein